MTDGNYFEYEVLDGENGKNGITPEITINATVNNSTGIPNVSVEKTGTIENPIFNLSFENLKGEKGENGQNGTDGSKENPIPAYRGISYYYDLYYYDVETEKIYHMIYQDEEKPDAPLQANFLPHEIPIFFEVIGNK